MKNYSEDASKQYHTQVGKGDIGRYILMPGDPKRCIKIAQYLDDAKLIADSREYTTYTGTLDGVKVSVTSSGIGGPSTAIAMEELSLCGADTFVRVGTCGGMQPQVKSGDLVVATGAIRMEGTTREYAPIEFPAVASFDVVDALIKASNNLELDIRPHYTEQGATSTENVSLESEKSKKTTKKTTNGDSSTAASPENASSESEKSEKSTKKDCSAAASAVHIGIVQCKDSFFGQHEPEKMPVAYELTEKWEAWKKLGCLASEMESAALFIVAAKLHARAGTCLLVVANQEREKLGLENPVVHDTDLVIRTAIEAVRILIREDAKKRGEQP